MAKRILDGMLAGLGIVIVVGVAFAIAWAGDVLTIDKDGTLKFAVSDAGKITVGATESYVNLVIQNNAAAANNKVDITADVLTVEGIRLETVNVSADLTLSGAGGLDTGSEASGTWYYVWVVTNNNGISTNGLLSLSSTSPTMPSGYTKKRRVGAVRNDASGNFLQFVQEGGTCHYNQGYASSIWGGRDTSWTTVDCNTSIPPTSRRAIFRLAGIVKYGTDNTPFNASIRPAVTGGNTTLTMNLRNNDTTHLWMHDVFGPCNTNGAQQVEYMIANQPDVGTGVYIAILGYGDRI